jgi:surface antigen
VTKADNSVAIRVSLGGFPNEQCAGRVRKGSRTADAGTISTSSNGGASWSWQVPGNVSHGQWKFSVTCSGGTHLHRASTSFRASGGIGPQAQGLWVPGSLRRRSVDQPHPAEGNGGGGASLYPVGQCTWWVAKHRPDLPFFPNRSGDALNWAKSAAAQGFPVGDVPAVGAVAVFQPNQYGAGRFGHVALVVAVLGRKIQISEANFRGKAGHDTRTIEYSGVRFIYRKGNPAPSLQATITGPAANQSLHGTVTITAISNAPGVRFAAFYYSNPAVRDSGLWESLGDDQTPDDGFSASWDTTSTPNQGGPGGSSVILRATVLSQDGTPTGADSEVRVNVANSRISGGQTYFPYYVVGTCEDGECALHTRSGPGYSSYPIAGEKHDGEELDVVCQGYGENFASQRGGASDIWDKLTDGNWVTDYYVDTPERGVPSAPVPLCP